MSHFLGNNLFIFLKQKTNPPKKKKILHSTVNFLTSCSPRTMCGCVREAAEIKPQPQIHTGKARGELLVWDGTAVLLNRSGFVPDASSWCSPAQQILIPNGDKMLQKLLALVPNAGLGLAPVAPFRLQHHAWLQIESLCCSLGNTATIFLKLHPKLL